MNNRVQYQIMGNTKKCNSANGKLLLPNLYEGIKDTTVKFTSIVKNRHIKRKEIENDESNI